MDDRIRQGLLERHFDFEFLPLSALHSFDDLHDAIHDGSDSIDVCADRGCETNEQLVRVKITPRHGFSSQARTSPVIEGLAGPSWALLKAVLEDPPLFHLFWVENAVLSLTFAAPPVLSLKR
jgi:hypothetical protein